MRHHRKLLRRLRAMYPARERRSVRAERNCYGRWRVVDASVDVHDWGCSISGLHTTRTQALRAAITLRSRETAIVLPWMPASRGVHLVPRKGAALWLGVRV